MKPSNFRRSKAAADAALPEARAIEIIRKEYARLNPINVRFRDTLDQDRKGADYFVGTGNGQHWVIDVKTRSSDCQLYNKDDIQLEIVSNLYTGAPGWAIRFAAITDHYLIVWTDTWRTQPLPAKALHYAVWRHYPVWSRHYRAPVTATECPDAPLGVYYSECLRVPRLELLEAIRAELVANPSLLDEGQ